MYTKEIPFLISFKRQAISTTTFTAKSEPWKSGDNVIIDAISVCSETSNNMVAHCGICHGNHNIYLESFKLGFHGRFYSTKNQILVPSDYRVVVQFEEPADGDIYYVNIFGRIRVCGN